MVTPDDILKRIPPNNLEAEQSVLGAIFLDNKAVGHAFETGLIVEDFYRETHRQIMKLMLQLDELKNPIDAITMTDALRGEGLLEQIGGPAYIAELASIVPTAANVAYYANIVRQLARLRRAASLHTDLASTAYETGALSVDRYFGEGLQAIQELYQPTIEHQHRFRPLAELTREALKIIETVNDRSRGAGAAAYGVSTCFPDLDVVTGGFQPGELCLLAARPSMGKTALALNIAANVGAMEGRPPVAIFSLEMTAVSLAIRMLCAEARVDSKRVLAGYIGERDYPRLASAAANLSEMDIWINDSSRLTPMQLRSSAEHLQHRLTKPLALITVDYLGLMKPSQGTADENRGMAEISGNVKALAKDLKTPVLALAQLNRGPEHREDHRPRMSDLRGSGSLEQDADSIWMLFRQGYYQAASDDGTSELIIAKQRNGTTDTIRLTFIRNYTKFESYAPETGVFGDA